MRFIRRDGSEGNFEPRKYPHFVTVSDGIYLNDAYSSDGTAGESVHFESHVIRRFEEDALSKEAGQALAAVALEWAEKLPHTIDYPKERP